jgi:arsenate reductase (glutaredoxin)
MQKVQLYGLPYCDGTKAVISWLDARGIQWSLHNYKTAGISQQKLAEWCQELGWQKILNKRSTTWRSLTPAQQNSTTTQAAAINLMLQNTSLIKRPVLETGKNILAGFDEKELNRIFKPSIN